MAGNGLRAYVAEEREAGGRLPMPSLIASPCCYWLRLWDPPLSSHASQPTVGGIIKLALTVRHADPHEKKCPTGIKPTLSSFGTSYTNQSRSMRFVSTMHPPPYLIKANREN